MRRAGVGLRPAIVRSVFSLLALIALSSPGYASSEAIFPRPASIEPNINFWLDVFTSYSYRDFVVHDRDKIWKVYEVMHVPGNGSPGNDEVQWANAYLKGKYADILNRLAAGATPTTYEERKVAELFKDEAPDAYLRAAQNLRVQQGMSERFRASLVRGKSYQPAMERIFSGAGLPVELAVLPSVESGFQNSARSTAGAVGIWQFTLSTGREFLTISRRRDDRLNPTRATEAAARLLRYNYEVLGDWALAITAYNYGTYGMARAAATLGSDFANIVQNYQGASFGFASKNYYSEFLAALQVHQYEDLYFPGIDGDAVPPMAAPRVQRASFIGSRHGHLHHVVAHSHHVRHHHLRHA